MVQQVCLHDLLWFFVDSLVPPTDEEAEGAEEDGEEAKVKVVKKDLEVKKQLVFSGMKLYIFCSCLGRELFNWTGVVHPHSLKMLNV